MRMINVFRRVRRRGITSVWSSLQHHFDSPGTPTKKVKIDDEEQQMPEEPLPLYSRHIHPHGIMWPLLLTLLVIFGVLAIFLYTIYYPPHLLIEFLQWKNPDVLFHVSLPASQKVVALTLDDAPSDFTPEILDLLASFNAKATFFAIGNQIQEHPNLLQRIHDEGHEIGNHAWADEPSFRLPIPILEKQILEVEDMLVPNTYGARYFRPGSGFFNQKMATMMKTIGYRIVLGGIYPHDPQIPHPSWNARHVLSMVRPGGIIIMHDRRSYSAEQLNLVLKGLKEKEWRVESVGGLLRFAEALKTKKGG